MENGVIMPANGQEFLDHMARGMDSGPPLSYSDRFVLFMDILGYRNLVRSKGSESPEEIYLIVRDSYWFHSYSDILDIRIISDSIVVISRDDEPSSFISIANIANNLVDSFLLKGILLRGAISYGSHFERHGITISPALIEAYELEAKEAVHPRVICSQSAADRVFPFVQSKDTGRRGIVGPKYFHVVRDQIPVKDGDGRWIVPFLPDRLEPYFLRFGHHHDPAVVMSDSQVEHCEKVGRQVIFQWKTGLESALAGAIEDRDREKVRYLIEKWNAYLRSFRRLTAAEKGDLAVQLP
jgi:hypothetical protein